jgi:hypothetical protein
MVSRRPTPPRYGPGVIPASAGRPTPELAPARATAWRVNEVRLVLGLLWREMDDVLGISEKTRKTRTSADSPTPFTTDELARLSTRHGVRPRYLLLGDGPMFEHEVAEAVGGESLSAQLLRHLCECIAAEQGANAEAIAQRLPDPAGLMRGIELGVAAALEDNRATLRASRTLANASIREAVRTAVHAEYSPPDLSRQVQEGARAVLRGEAELPPASAPPSRRRRQRDSR